jgi:hypothetical protein
VTECPPGGAAPSERSASGLLEWESINDAMEALAMMNHHQMKNTSMYPIEQGHKDINTELVLQKPFFFLHNHFSNDNARRAQVETLLSNLL